MTVRSCLIAKAKNGTLRAADAEAAADLFENLEAEERALGNISGAKDYAGLSAEQILRRDAALKKAVRLKQIDAQLLLMRIVADNPGNESRAMLAALDFDPTAMIKGVMPVSIMTQIVRGNAHAIMTDFLSKYHSKAAGLTREKASLRTVIRELFGENTGDAASKHYAKSLSEMAEYLRLEFNRASGGEVILKRNDWGWVQSHNRAAIARASKSDWVDFVYGRLNREQMIDFDTGRPMSDQKLYDTLNRVYDNIVTNGLNDLQPGGFTRRSLVKQRQEHRFLIFRDADSWLEYQERFGEADLFKMVAHHAEQMSRDIAIFHVLGPNPDATVQFMEQLVRSARVQRAAGLEGKAAARLVRDEGKGVRALRDTYNVLSGATGVPNNHLLANVSQGLRNMLVASMLGSSFFSALADTTFANLTAKINGIPAAKVLARHLRLFSPTSAADKRQAIRLGFGAQGWTQIALSAQRVLGEVAGPEWTKVAADVVLRMSFMSPWTEAGRWGFATEFSGYITNQIGKSFDQLDEPLQRAFERTGITPDEWDVMRTTDLWIDPETGADFLRAQDIVARDDIDNAFDVGNKLQQLILTEMEFAIPTASARVRGLLTFGQPGGSFWGEAIRNVALFKSFPVTIMHTHLQRGIHQRGMHRKATYMAHLLIGTAIMGGLGEQMSQITQGKDPRPMNTNTPEGTKFWMQALMRGGGLGFFGDFLFSDQNRYGGGIVNALAGPVLGTVLPKGAKATIGNLQNLIKDEDTNFGREFVDFAETLLPGKSLWWGRTAFERLVTDEIKSLADPDFNSRMREKIRRVRRERGQEYWWRPGGGIAPQRFPNIPLE